MAKGTYKITSPEGIKIAEGLKAGGQYHASDGSTWKKLNDGSVTVISAAGNVTTNAYQPPSTNSGGGNRNGGNVPTYNAPATPTYNQPTTPTSNQTILSSGIDLNTVKDIGEFLAPMLSNGAISPGAISTSDAEKILAYYQNKLTANPGARNYENAYTKLTGNDTAGVLDSYIKNNKYQEALNIELGDFRDQVKTHSLR